MNAEEKDLEQAFVRAFERDLICTTSNHGGDTIGRIDLATIQSTMDRMVTAFGRLPDVFVVDERLAPQIRELAEPLHGGISAAGYGIIRFLGLPIEFLAEADIPGRVSLLRSEGKIPLFIGRV